jgi:hypothetical protein
MRANVAPAAKFVYPRNLACRTGSVCSLVRVNASRIPSTRQIVATARVNAIRAGRFRIWLIGISKFDRGFSSFERICFSANILRRNSRVRDHIASGPKWFEPDSGRFKRWYEAFNLAGQTIAGFFAG